MGYDPQEDEFDPTAAAENAWGGASASTGAAEPTGGNDDATRAAAIKAGAEKLGIDPVDYATAMSYESGGTFDPWKKGPVTKWGQHRGTIQYGEPQQKQYGVTPNQSFEDQVTNSNVRYLKDHGVKPGMNFNQIYSAINGGSVNKNPGTQDANTGRTVGDNIRLAQSQHRPKVVQRFGQYFGNGGAFDPDAAAKAAWGIDASQPSFDADAAARAAWGIQGDDPGSQAGPPTETPETLDAQRQAANDPNSTRIGVLYTDPATAGAPADGEFDIPISNNQVLRTNSAKLGSYMKQTGTTVHDIATGNADFTPLIGGKASPTGEPYGATGQVAVVTMDEDGNELVLSIVANPADVPKQAALDALQFPGKKIHTKVVPAQDVAAMRKANEPATSADYDEYIKSLGPNDVRMSIDEFNQAVAANPGTTSVQYQMGKPIVNGEEVDAQQAEKTPDGGQIILPAQIGQQSKEGDIGGSTAAIYTAPEGMSYRDAQKAALMNAASKFGGSGEGWEKVLFKLYDPETEKAWNAAKGPGRVEVTYNTLESMGIDAKRQHAIMQARVRNEIDQPNLNPVPFDFAKSDAEELKKEYEGGRYGTLPAAAIGGFMGGWGRFTGTLGGLLSYVNDLNPAKGESIPESLLKGGATDAQGNPVSLQQVRSVGTDLIGDLKQFHDDTQAFQQNTRVLDKDGNETWPSALVQTAGATPFDLPKLMIMSSLPGGITTALALDGAAMARLAGASGKEQLKQAGKGFLMGLAFGAAGKFGKVGTDVIGTVANRAVSPLVTAGIELGTVGGGTYTVGKAFGDPDAENLRSAIINILFHLQGQVHGAINGKIIRARDEKGNVIAAKLDDNGKVTSVDPETEPNIEMLVPKFQSSEGQDVPRAAKAAEPEKPTIKDRDGNEYILHGDGFGKKGNLLRVENVKTGARSDLPQRMFPDYEPEAKVEETPNITQTGENRDTRRASTAVPETEAEAETQYSSQLDEIRQNNARTKAEVQALFPQLSREEAADLREQAWNPRPAPEQLTELRDYQRKSQAFDVPLIPEGHKALDTEIAQPIMTKTGRVSKRTKKTSIAEMQKPLEERAKIVEDLLNCLHG